MLPISLFRVCVCVCACARDSFSLQLDNKFLKGRDHSKCLLCIPYSMLFVHIIGVS
jgi:hypothetical protein